MMRSALPPLFAFAAAACNRSTPGTPTVAEAVIIPVESYSGPLPEHCHSAYWPCVPRARDVDCVGGSGNGPLYVRGPIDIITSDPYGLDQDNDGVGCSP